LILLSLHFILYLSKILNVENWIKVSQYLIEVVVSVRLELSLILLLIVLVIGVIISPFVIPFLYTHEFQASVIPFQILLGGMFFSSLTKTLSSYIFAVGKVKINLLATVVGVIITLILDFTLIPRYGIIGAAWATNITYFGIFAVCFIFLWNKGKKDGIGNRVWRIFVPYITTTRIRHGR